MTTEDEILKVARHHAVELEQCALIASTDLSPAIGRAMTGAAAFLRRLDRSALAAHLAAGAEPVGTCTEGGVLWHKNFLENWPSAGTLLYATPPAPAVKIKALSVDDLAQEIRRADMHDGPLGAGALAEALMPFIRSALVDDAGAADLDARRELEVDGFGALPVLEPTPAPALNLHDCYLREQAAKPATPAPVSDDLVEPPYRIRVAQDGNGFWSCAAAISGSQEYVRSDLVVAKDATIASLREEVERKDAALGSCRAATEFFDRAMAAPMHERIAAGQDPWNWVEAACRKAAALAPIPATEG